MNDYGPRLPLPELFLGLSVNGPIEQGIANFASAVVLANSVAPLVTEIVRLRCAKIHHCRLYGLTIGL